MIRKGRHPNSNSTKQLTPFPQLEIIILSELPYQVYCVLLTRTLCLCNHVLKCEKMQDKIHVVEQTSGMVGNVVELLGPSALVKLSSGKGTEGMR